MILNINLFEVSKNCNILGEHEKAIKKKINKFTSESDLYGGHRIRIWKALAFILIIPFCVMHMLLMINKENFFLDIVSNDLSKKIFHSLNKACWLGRFSGWTKKLFIQPLRIYSHTCRGEWFYSSKLMYSLVKYACFIHVTIFFFCFKNKKFFLREDFYGASSCLASLREIWGGPDIISFQHGSMSLDAIRRHEVYPGQRARLQIVHDENTFNLFKKLSLNPDFIIGPVGCYYPIEFNSAKCRKIIFIGNGSTSVREQIFEIINSISRQALDFGFDIFYKPHPREVFDICASNSFILMKNADEDNVLGDRESKLFIGVTSTVLYDAYLMNQKVLLLKNSDSKTLDSLFLLDGIEYLYVDNNIWESIINKINKFEPAKNLTENINNYLPLITKNISNINLGCKI
jgi:hypothetical protein